MNRELIIGTDVVGSHTLQVIAKADRFNEWMYREFRSFLKGRVLEIGSGIGNISSLAISDGLRITLSDLNPAYIQRLKERFGNSTNVDNILEIDLLHPEFENMYGHLKETFNSIFLLNVIEHIDHDDLAIRNCNYLLAPQGHLVVLAPAFDWLYCGFDSQLGHFRRYTLGKMCRKLIKQGFGIIHKQYFNLAGIGGWILYGKIFRRNMIESPEMSRFNKIVPIAKFIDRLFMKKMGLSIIVTGIKK